MPWKPVNIKKEVPNLPSLMQKKEFLYSIIWRKVNNTPSEIVKKSQKLDFLFDPLIKK